MGDESETGGDGDPYAGSVGLSRIEVNPAVPISIYADEAWVPLADRTALIPRDREALIRVYVDVSDDFADRLVDARLIVHSGFGGQDTRTETTLVEFDSRARDLDTTLNFALGTQDVNPGTEIAIELLDRGEVVDRLPAEGTQPLEVSDDELTLRVMLVPIAYESETCSSVGTPTEDDIEAIGTALYQTFPVQKVQLGVRSNPIAWNEKLTNNWVPLLQKMITMRGSDGLDDDLYYLGLVDFCDEDPPVSAVVPAVPGPTPEDADKRVGITSLRSVPKGGGGLNGMMFVLGILNGRLTVPCFYGGGLDDSYPYDMGYIGDWGYGVLDGRLKDPNVYVDLAAACQTPTRWVSDYTWRGLYEHIRIVTEWAN
jgi:hypothetical protein